MDGNIKLLKAKCGTCGELLSRGGNNKTTHLKRHIKKHACANGQNKDIRKQMQLAINAAGKQQLLDDENQFNVLGWWKTNHTLYPVLSLMARDLLSVLASTVASDAAFSVRGQVVSEKSAEQLMKAKAARPDWMVDSKDDGEDASEDNGDDEIEIVSNRVP
ncbi:hypothetical protein ACLB2K_020578 [Fragaria x ananassa]